MADVAVVPVQNQRSSGVIDGGLRRRRALHLAPVADLPLVPLHARVVVRQVVHRDLVDPHHPASVLPVPHVPQQAALLDPRPRELPPVVAVVRLLPDEGDERVRARDAALRVVVALVKPDEASLRPFEGVVRVEAHAHVFEQVGGRGDLLGAGGLQVEILDRIVDRIERALRAEDRALSARRVVQELAPHLVVRVDGALSWPQPVPEPDDQCDDDDRREHFPPRRHALGLQAPPAAVCGRGELAAGDLCQGEHQPAEEHPV
mmetsp:Transcript_26447/g.63831  ORF Transcript_26447/g.63831 Transcript_26447/m.63831 type:complete len:261 (+) Transcript_26447:2346-3128(+)